MNKWKIAGAALAALLAALVLAAFQRSPQLPEASAALQAAAQ